MKGLSFSKLKFVYSVITNILPLLIRNAPYLLSAIVWIKICVAFIPAGQALLLLKSTDSTASVLAGTESWVEPIKWLLLIAALSVAQTVLSSASEYISVLLRQRFEYRLEEMLAHKAAKIPLVLFDQADYYDTLQRAKSNISVRGIRIVELMLTIFQSLITLAGYAILLTQFSWLLIIAMIASTIPTLLVHMKIGEWRCWLQRYSIYVLWVCYSKKLSLGTFVAVSQILASTQMKNVAYSLSQFYEESMITSRPLKQRRVCPAQPNSYTYAERVRCAGRSWISGCSGAVDRSMAEARALQGVLQRRVDCRTG